MRARSLTVYVAVCTVLAAFAVPAFAQQTPPSMVETYESLADIILAARDAETHLVESLLDGHRHGAQAFYDDGDYTRAAAEMALFANEGDNAIGGVRKRLVEGGHHHNAEGEEKGIYEPGFVIVTRDAKEKILEASATVRRNASAAEREAAWKTFNDIADELLKKKMM
jgi:hypothetical protein